MGKPLARCYEDLIVWQKALAFALTLHKVTAGFPRHELFGLTSQLRRAAISVASNVAEGSARSSTREFMHFLKVARGSLAEAHTQLLLGHRVGYLTDEQLLLLEPDIAELGRLINAVLTGLQRRLEPPASAG